MIPSFQNNSNVRPVIRHRTNDVSTPKNLHRLADRTVVTFDVTRFFNFAGQLYQRPRYRSQNRYKGTCLITKFRISTTINEMNMMSRRVFYEIHIQCC